MSLEPPDGWEEVEGGLQREFRFNDFADAVDFVNRVAEVAERANHHPEIIIRWNRVTLRWRTQTAGAVTRRDIELAGQNERVGIGRRASCWLHADVVGRVAGGDGMAVEGICAWFFSMIFRARPAKLSLAETAVRGEMARSSCFRSCPVQPLRGSIGENAPLRNAERGGGMG